MCTFCLDLCKSGLTASVLAASEILTNDSLFEGWQDSVESSITYL
jgi:hypothetical protein